MNISFRQIKNDDLEFLWQLHNSALKEYVAQTWGWNETWQRTNFEKQFNPAEGEIITVDKIDAGFLWVIKKQTEVLLASIRLVPEFQNRRIGTTIIKNLLSASLKPVRLQVLKVNRARYLYERLGFEIADETETHFTMIKNAAQEN